MIPLAIITACFTCGLAALIVSSILRTRRKVPIDGLPVVPNAHWLAGHFHLFRRMLTSSEFETIQRILCYDHANSDGISCFWLFSPNPWVAVTRPSDVRKVLTAASFRRPTAIQQRHLGMFIGKKSLAAMRGREWRYWRSAVHRAFTPAALKGLQKHMVDAAHTLATSLGRRIDDAGSKSGPSSEEYTSITLDVEPLMKMLTMDTFGRSALGIDFQCCSQLAPSSVASAFDFLSEQLMHRFRTFFRPASHFYNLPTEDNRRHRRESAVVRGVLQDAIRSRRNSSVNSSSGSTCSGEYDDLLSHLLRAVEADAQKNGDDKSTDASEEILSDILMTLLFAGYETTAITLTYALYCLARNPDAEARVEEEVSAVLGSSSTKAPPLDPEQLPYCRAIIMETLRLYPPGIQTVRSLDNALEIGGFSLPVGTQILIPIWSIQRDERYYPRPQEFLPERWVCRRGDSDGENDSRWRDRRSDDDRDGGASDIPAASRDAFFAFSGGARSCVGRKFAMQEAITMLALLLRDLKFEYIDGYELEPFRSGIVQKPRCGMPMKISRRKDDCLQKNDAVVSGNISYTLTT